MSPPPDRHCSWCEFPAQTLCSGCKVTRYCSPQCQKLEWPTHKKYCKLLQSHPPPKGFIPNMNSFAFFNSTPLSPSGLPIYPTPWAITRTGGLFDTPPSQSPGMTLEQFTAKHKGDAETRVRRMLSVRAGAEVRGVMDMGGAIDGIRARMRKEGETVWEGLGEEMCDLKVVDAYRLYCWHGMEMCGETPILRQVYTPSNIGFRDYFLHPLLLLPPTSRRAHVPPHFPTSPSLPSRSALLTRILTTLSKYPPASLSSPITAAEVLSLETWGQQGDLLEIVTGVREGLILSKETEWVMFDWEGKLGRGEGEEVERMMEGSAVTPPGLKELVEEGEMPSEGLRRMVEEGKVAGVKRRE